MSEDPTFEGILNALKTLSEQFTVIVQQNKGLLAHNQTLNDKLAVVEEAVVKIAVQEEKLLHMQEQQGLLLKKVESIKETQDRCPMKSVSLQQKVQWSLHIFVIGSLMIKLLT